MISTNCDLKVCIAVAFVEPAVQSQTKNNSESKKQRKKRLREEQSSRMKSVNRTVDYKHFLMLSLERAVCKSSRIDATRGASSEFKNHSLSALSARFSGV